MLTELEVRALSGSDAERGWLEIPSTCPEKFKIDICEKRKSFIEGKRNRSTSAAELKQRKARVEAVMAEINSQKDADADSLLKLKAQAAALLL